MHYLTFLTWATNLTKTNNAFNAFQPPIPICGTQAQAPFVPTADVIL